MLEHLTGGQPNKVDLAALHVELVNPDHRLPFSFLVAELIKGLSTQRRTKKREEWHKLEASILAKKSFLDNIPHLACVSNIISDWLTSLFSLPASASTGPYRANLPPSANPASCTRGDHTGRSYWENPTASHYFFFHCTTKAPDSCQPDNGPSCRLSCSSPPPNTLYSAKSTSPGIHSCTPLCKPATERAAGSTQPSQPAK